MTVIETDRLILRHMTLDDAPFILELVNDPAWLAYIGDRGVRTLDDARGYITKGSLDMYARLGFGLFVMTLKDGGTPIGICGLLKRDTLDDVEIGFAMLPRYRSQGYAFEAATATLKYGFDVLGFPRIVAIVSPGNHRSTHLLERLGMRDEGMLQLTEGREPAGLSKCFVCYRRR